MGAAVVFTTTTAIIIIIIIIIMIFTVASNVAVMVAMRLPRRSQYNHAGTRTNIEIIASLVWLSSLLPLSVNLQSFVIDIAMCAVALMMMMMMMVMMMMIRNDGDIMSTVTFVFWLRLSGFVRRCSRLGFDFLQGASRKIRGSLRFGSWCGCFPRSAVPGTLPVPSRYPMRCALNCATHGVRPGAAWRHGRLASRRTLANPTAGMSVNVRSAGLQVGSSMVPNFVLGMVSVCG